MASDRQLSHTCLESVSGALKKIIKAAVILVFPMHGRFLKLTGCEDDAFTCNDGQCISMAERCDQVIDCRDGLEENDCTLLVIDGGYNKRLLHFL